MGYCSDGPDHAFVWKFCLFVCKFGNFGFGKKAVEYFKWGLMNHPRRNMEDIGVEDNLNCENLTLDVSVENFSM